MSVVKVATLSELPLGEGVMREVDGEPICLVRTDDTTVKAIHNVCSHGYFELDGGYVDGSGTTIECGLHGAAFDLETGEPHCIPATKPVPAYTVIVDNDDVLIDPVPNNGAEPADH